MLKVPPAIQIAFERKLAAAGITPTNRAPYRRFLRYYLDFCARYRLSSEQGSVEPFIRKLASKGVDGSGQRLARKAVHTHLDADTPKTPGIESGASQPAVPRETIPAHNNASWAGELQSLKDLINTRHYSPHTLSTYLGWVRRFQTFPRSRSPSSLTLEDFRNYLSHLASVEGVAASTQNQAFNALLFFYRHVLKQEPGRIDGIVRAKRRPYIPVVLSRREVDSVIAGLERPFRLPVQLLYGCGLRLSECISLRIHCLNLDERILTIHDGKGRKDRTVPLPEALATALLEHLDDLRQLHRKDLEAGYAGVFLPKQLEKKYRNASREFIWQWLFPARRLTRLPGTDSLKRYHLHTSQMSEAFVMESW